jgi:hypothetical protein
VADVKVTQMGDTFVNTIPSDWSATKGSWQYFDVKNCWENGTTCYGNNPSSPYGFPNFEAIPNQQILNFKLNSTEAVVIFLRTPPPLRYFGFSQYLFTRGGNPEPVFASVGDTLNLLKISTFASPSPGVNVFNQHAVLIWSADLSTYASVKDMLIKQGIPKAGINFIGLPILLPLFMGNTPTSDTFNMLMRTAFPTVQADYDAYTKENPFYVVKVGLKVPGANNPAPTIDYANETSGISEGTKAQSMTALQTALNSLVVDIKKKYLKDFILKDQLVNYTEKVGWDCIAGNGKCNGDNHDALYSLDSLGSIVTTNPKDLVIIAGVNHQKTGKALYLNHSIYETTKFAGISAVGDSSFTTESALFHAGVTLPKDPKRLQYQNLYAYIISYNCNGLNYCHQIPAPTPENPVGLLPNTPFLLIGRSYVDKLTKVRPSLNEVVKHQVILGSARATP